MERKKYLLSLFFSLKYIDCSLPLYIVQHDYKTIIFTQKIEFILIRIYTNAHTHKQTNIINNNKPKVFTCSTDLILYVPIEAFLKLKKKR